MKVNEMITKKILEELDKGNVPWQKTWGSVGFPKNLVSKKPYRGVNVLMLILEHYSSPWWVTFKQAKELGGDVKKGEHGTPVVFWKTFEAPDFDEKSNHLVKTVPFLRYYTVFNTDQCEGLEGKVPAVIRPAEVLMPLDACEQIVNGYTDKPQINYTGDVASYRPQLDVVHCPPLKFFKRPEDFYSVLFHECVHSTGHKSRLERLGVSDCGIFGSENYSKEELVAEIGAIFLVNLAGIQVTFENSVSYLRGWMKRLSQDHSLIIQAASQAQKAYDYILGIKEESNGNGSN